MYYTAVRLRLLVVVSLANSHAVNYCGEAVLLQGRGENWSRMGAGYFSHLEELSTQTRLGTAESSRLGGHLPKQAQGMQGCRRRRRVGREEAGVPCGRAHWKATQT